MLRSGMLHNERRLLPTPSQPPNYRSSTSLGSNSLCLATKVPRVHFCHCWQGAEPISAPSAPNNVNVVLCSLPFSTVLSVTAPTASLRRQPSCQPLELPPAFPTSHSWPLLATIFDGLVILPPFYPLTFPTYLGTQPTGRCASSSDGATTTVGTA